MTILFKRTNIYRSFASNKPTWYCIVYLLSTYHWGVFHLLARSSMFVLRGDSRILIANIIRRIDTMPDKSSTLYRFSKI